MLESTARVRSRPDDRSAAAVSSNSEGGKRSREEEGGAVTPKKNLNVPGLCRAKAPLTFAEGSMSA